MANSVDTDQTAPIGAVCSGSTLFASILKFFHKCLSIIFSRRLQQTTFSEAFFLSALRVKSVYIGYDILGELHLSGNHTVTEYNMSGRPYSQKSGLKNHRNEQIFQVMARFDRLMTR